MTGDTRADNASDAVHPSIERLPDGVRETAEVEIDGDLHRSATYTCRKCGLTEYGIKHDSGVQYIVNGEAGGPRMQHLSDTSAGAFHLDGNDADDPFMCEPCFDDVRFRGALVIGTMPSGERTGYRADGRVVAYPYWELETPPRETPLDDAMRAVVDERRPEFDGEPMVDIRNRIGDERRETIVEGEAGVHAVAFGSNGAVFVPEREVDEAVNPNGDVNADELPAMLRVEETAARNKVHHEAAETAVGFDCTDFGDAETFRRVLESVNLDPEDDRYRLDAGDETDAVAHVWANDAVMIQTGNDPLSGEYGEPSANRDPEPGYASLIGIEGREHAVGSLFREVKRHAAEIDDVDGTGRAFI